MWFIVGFSLVFGDSVYGFIGNPASYPLFYALRDGTILINIFTHDLWSCFSILKIIKRV